MKVGRIVALLLVLFLIPAHLAAGDVGTLEEAFEEVVERLNNHDQEGFLKLWHPDAVLIVYDYFFPVDRSDAGDELWTQIFKDFFSTSKRFSMTPVDIDFRVVGTTGIVWGMVQMLVESNQGESEIRSLRITASFVEEAGKWKLLSWHSSLPPENNRRSIR